MSFAAITRRVCPFATNVFAESAIQPSVPFTLPLKLTRPDSEALDTRVNVKLQSNPITRAKADVAN